MQYWPLTRDCCLSGVSYLLPADAETLLDAARQNHKLQQETHSSAAATQQQQQLYHGPLYHGPVIDDEKHRQFLDSVVSVSTFNSHIY